MHLSTRYQKFKDANTSMAKEIEEQLPGKPVSPFSKVTSHRTDKQLTEEKKYKIKDDDGNINFTREHQSDDTENINITNIYDNNRRSILQKTEGLLL